MDQSKPNILLPNVNAIFTALDLEPCRTVTRSQSQRWMVATKAQLGSKQSARCQ